jgi:hypothetical protein
VCLGRIAWGDACPRVQLLGYRKSSMNNTCLLAPAVGENCYRAIIQGSGGEKTLRAATGRYTWLLTIDLPVWSRRRCQRADARR